MKKNLLMMAAAVLFAACSVDNDEMEALETQSLNATASDECSLLAGNDNVDFSITPTDIATNYRYTSDIKALYLSLLDEGVPDNGTFSPTIEALVKVYNDRTRYQLAGTYSTTYTVTSGDCTDSANLAITVCYPEDAGPDNTSNLITTNYISQNLNTAEKLKGYYLSLLGEGIKTTGTFSPTIEDLIASYNSKTGAARAGVYTTTYSLGSGVCEDTATLAVEVCVSENAGADNTSTVLTTSEISSQYRYTHDIVALYYSLLEPGVSRTGTFNPPIEELVAEYNRKTRPNLPGVYSSTYTLGEGPCADSAVISVTVVAPGKK